MEKPANSSPESKKRKRKTKGKSGASEPKNVKLDTEIIEETGKDVEVQKAPKVMLKSPNTEEIAEKYPVLKNQELIDKFLKVSLTNNQKGRIRQLFRDILKGTDDSLRPDIIHNKIQSILKDKDDLTDPELRKIRILFNMLNTSLGCETKTAEKTKKEKVKKVKNKGDGDVKLENGDIKKENGDVQKEKGDVKKEKKEKKDQKEQKVKGPKRYVVFVGNLPLDIDKEKIMNHFSDLNDHIKDVRLPPPGEGKKSAIAYLELSNEPSYELALSKHHSMFGNKRINVLYTAQKNGKISEAEAKGKSAKLIALQKSGKLIGSVPLNKKRSHRRSLLKQARAREAAQSA